MFNNFDDIGFFEEDWNADIDQDENVDTIYARPPARWYITHYDDLGLIIGYSLMPTWSWTRGVMKLKKSEINKFYVGAEHIARSIDAGENDSWTHATEEDAIAHAQKLIARDQKTVIICKIIAIVEKETPPVKITRL